MLANPPIVTNSGERLLQTRLDAACRRKIDKQKSNRLTDAVSKWIATNCWPVSTEEDVALCDVFKTATNDV